MQSPCMREVSQICLNGCCPTPFVTLPDPQNPKTPKPKSTSSACRSNFFDTTTTAFFPNTQFTNHESLPSLEESYTEFIEAYPQFLETNQADEVRAEEYNHLSLSKQICLDYTGIGLFSHSQLQNQNSAKSPFFYISYNSVDVKSQLLHGGKQSKLESAIKKKIMGFLNISRNDYSMVFVANRTAAFKLLAEAYPFQSSKNLLTVYDYESEAVEAMIDISAKRGARISSAEFSWPRMRIQSAKLKKLLIRKRTKKENTGLFVFPLQSRMSGARYSYLWMKMAQENGWRVLLDACALGPKDMNSLGLSLFQPDFLIWSFYKVFGENPSGFACLFVKKTTVSILEASRSTGIISLLPEKKVSPSAMDTSEDDLDNSSSFSGPISIQATQSRIHEGETSEQQNTEVEKTSQLVASEKLAESGNGRLEVQCRGLDHVDTLGLILISSRGRYLVNWLINALTKLQHPNTEKGIQLVRIYGPKVRFDRGPAVAFNVYDWKGEKVDPVLVQKLADRSNISLSYGFLHKIWFSDKYKEDERLLERRTIEGNGKEKVDRGIKVITASFAFLTDFVDTYRLWAFVAQFLDADFVEKERWRYTALMKNGCENGLHGNLYYITLATSLYPQIEGGPNLRLETHAPYHQPL